MRWRKKGLIYAPDGSRSWQKQFAMAPTPFLMEDRIRIFVGLCDENMVGRVGFVDVASDNPNAILAVSQKPALNIGQKGAFDDHGVVPACLLQHEGALCLYYIGFHRPSDVPYTMFTGLAISHDGGQNFTRYDDLPILSGRSEERYARCGTYVVKDRDNFKMWYVGSFGDGWTINENGKKLPLYRMKHLSSDSPFQWQGEPRDVFDSIDEDEHGFGRPYIWCENDLYKMYYSKRTYSAGYAIGYAESKDGINWRRMDAQAGIAPSGSGWDGQNITFPALCRTGDKVYMFYNGNDAGKTGFGYAELTDEN